MPKSNPSIRRQPGSKTETNSLLTDQLYNIKNSFYLEWTFIYFSWCNATQYRNSMHLTLVVFFSFCRSGCYASYSPFCKSQSARLTVKDSFLLVLIVPFYVVTSRRVLTIVLSHDSSWDFFVEHELLGNHSSCTQGDFSSWTENQKITNLEIKPEQVQHARKYKKLSGHFNSLEVDNFLVFF